MPQSTICADTGNQATISFASGISESFKIREIDPSEQSVAPLDCSDLSTTDEKTFRPEDLPDPSELSIEYLFDTFETPPVIGTDLGNVTITYPLRPGETTPATLVGSAYVSAVKKPRLANNELQIGSFKVQFDGQSVAAFTEST